MSKNMQRFSATLTNRMKRQTAAAVPTSIDLGIVNSNLSITTDSLQAAIPKGDYMVNLALTGGIRTSTESHTHSGGEHSQYSGSGSHSHSGGAHSHNLPSTFRDLLPGDRVLVAWCGNEPVVIAIVVSS